jgi:hypothetical protein
MIAVPLTERGRTFRTKETWDAFTKQRSSCSKRRLRQHYLPCPPPPPDAWPPPLLKEPELCAELDMVLPPEVLPPELKPPEE